MVLKKLPSCVQTLVDPVSSPEQHDRPEPERQPDREHAQRAPPGWLGVREFAALEHQIDDALDVGRGAFGHVTARREERGAARLPIQPTTPAARMMSGKGTRKT